jgi:hypothetical protein
MTREKRERELLSILSDPVGRSRLLEMLRQQMKLSPGEFVPVGTPIIESILNHEFAAPPT